MSVVTGWPGPTIMPAAPSSGKKKGTLHADMHACQPCAPSVVGQKVTGYAWFGNWNHPSINCLLLLKKKNKWVLVLQEVIATTINWWLVSYSGRYWENHCMQMEGRIQEQAAPLKSEVLNFSEPYATLQMTGYIYGDLIMPFFCRIGASS